MPPLALMAALVLGAAPLYNVETFVPPQCYTKTEGNSNPCYVCHTPAQRPNFLSDVELQASYAFAEPALKNHWTNLFQDRREAVKAIADADVDRWVRTDNYGPWRKRLAPGQFGWIPDLDYQAGFDADGFAKDGSGWRALRYAPFPGTFWPTNGSTDDVFIRLPLEFRTDAAGRYSREVYQRNLAILETSLKLPAPGPGERESAAAAKLPKRFTGAAAGVPVVPRVYPKGTEFFHTVRYLDPAAPGFVAARVKEVRYAKKTRFLDESRLSDFYEEELEEKRKGVTRMVAGTPGVGYRNGTGWTYLGWIEDAAGHLRAQNNEEMRFCLGCHAAIGATRDSSFAFPRKLPGAAGWRVQSLAGQIDVPMPGMREGHVYTYFKRVRGADEFRANEEMLDRFFKDGAPDERALRRAAPGGDRDLAWLLTPSPARAYALNKAYMLIVREQSFIKGRDSVVAPVKNVHAEVTNEVTENGAAGNVFADGTLLLDFD